MAPLRGHCHFVIIQLQIHLCQKYRCAGRVKQNNSKLKFASKPTVDNRRVVIIPLLSIINFHPLCDRNKSYIDCYFFG